MELTERELKEIKFALIYDEQFKHGTDGNNPLIIVAKLARFAGFNLDKIDAEMSIPSTVKVTE
jgi:hypothetical protein